MPYKAQNDEYHVEWSHEVGIDKQHGRGNNTRFSLYYVVGHSEPTENLFENRLISLLGISKSSF